MKLWKENKWNKVVVVGLGGIILLSTVCILAKGQVIKNLASVQQEERSEESLAIDEVKEEPVEELTLEEAWIKATSPTIEYMTDDSQGRQIFDELVPDLEAYIHGICKEVAQMLYKTPEEVPVFEKLTFCIYETEGVAWKTGAPPSIEVTINSKYLEEYAVAGTDISEEVKGILFHELTHAYQHSSRQETSAVEGVADLVRYMSGHTPLYKRTPGGSYMDSYKTTAFFLDWVRAVYAEEFDFLYEFNQTAHPNNRGTWSWDDAFMKVTGRHVDELWDGYQQELIEKGMECRTSIERKTDVMDQESGNLAFGKVATANQEVGAHESAAKAVDGQIAGINNGNTKWCSTSEDDKWLMVDLGEKCTIKRWVVKHAGAGGENAAWNTKAFKLQASQDGITWIDVDSVIDNKMNVTDREVEAFETQYVRLYITEPTQNEDTAARIYEFELY